MTDPSLDELVYILGFLNADEIEVMREVGRGLINGRKVYGELVIDSDRRDFVRERWEENRDALVYAAIDAIKVKRGAA